MLLESLRGAGWVAVTMGQSKVGSQVKSLSAPTDVALVEVIGMVLVLVYVMRDLDEVRVISLRRGSKQERKLYAENLR